MISIIIPTYQRTDYLARLLDSIQTQTYSDYEVIIIDDASPNAEDYARLVADYRSRLDRFDYIRLDRNRGAPHARNLGIRKSRGEWLALVDDDDEWLPEKLARQWETAGTAPPEVGLIYTWARVLDGCRDPLFELTYSLNGRPLAQLCTVNFIIASSVLIRKETFQQVGLFDETLPSCQDWDMWMRILLGGFHLEVVPEILTLYHQHGQTSISFSPRVSLGYKMFLEKHWPTIWRETGPLNSARKMWLYAKACKAVYWKPEARFVSKKKNMAKLG